MILKHIVIQKVFESIAFATTFTKKEPRRFWNIAIKKVFESLEFATTFTKKELRKFWNIA